MTPGTLSGTLGGTFKKRPPMFRDMFRDMFRAMFRAKPLKTLDFLASGTLEHSFSIDCEIEEIERKKTLYPACMRICIEINVDNVPPPQIGG